MAGSINKVILVGNLGRDPEIRSMQDGGKIVQLSIATSESWKDRNSGERRERTEWHRVVIFNEALGNIAEQYLRKGSTVYIERSTSNTKMGRAWAREIHNRGSSSTIQRRTHYAWKSARYRFR